MSWEAAYASSWVVESSLDGSSYSQAVSVSTASAGPQHVSFAARTARYVRIRALRRATGWGVSFWDVAVLGPEDTAEPPPPPPPPPPPTADLALGAPATASSSYPGHAPGLADDGIATTRWSSAFTNAQWWQADLGSAKTVGRVVIAWERAYASRYEIQTSAGGVSFTTAATVDLTGPVTRATSFTPRSARYVRVLGRTRATPYGISFYACEVYAS